MVILPGQESWTVLCRDPPCADPVGKECVSGKNLPASEGDIRDVGLTPGSGRSPAAGHPLQYSCPGNHVDRRAWRATVHGVAESQTRLKWPSNTTHTHRKRSAVPVRAQRGRGGGGVGRKVHDGDMCALVMDSCCYMTEANTDCKAIVLRLKTN